MTPRRYNLWFLVRRAVDLPGQWTAHCLELDVVTQGESVEHAIRMLAEASVMTLADDLEHGRDPFDRRAPDEYWAELYRIVREGLPGQLAELAAAGDRLQVVAGQVEFHVFEQARSSLPDVPALWSRSTSAGHQACA